MNYPNSWWGLGNYDVGNDSYASWLLKNPITGEFSIFKTNTWYHLCLAYEKGPSRISLVMNGIVMKHEADSRIRNVLLPQPFEKQIFVGRSPMGFSDHLGKITDINMWRNALGIEHMIQWTKCM